MSSSDSDDSAADRIEPEKSPDLSDSEEFFPNPILDDHIDHTQSATDTYKSAIESLRGYNNRKLPSSQGVRQSKSSEQTTALVDAEEFIDDDWLIDDMQQPTKRQRLDLNGVFSSNSSRKKSDDSFTRKTSSSRTKTNRSVIIEDDDSNFNNDMENIGIDADNSHVDVNIIADKNNTNSYTQNTNLPTLQQSQRTKPRQLSLTNFAVRVSNDSTNKQETTVPNDSIVADYPTSSNTPSVLRESSGPAMRVKVRVKDKLLLIPVPYRYHFIKSFFCKT